MNRQPIQLAARAHCRSRSAAPSPSADRRPDDRPTLRPLPLPPNPPPRHVRTRSQRRRPGSVARAPSSATARLVPRLTRVSACSWADAHRTSISPRRPRPPLRTLPPSSRRLQVQPVHEPPGRSVPLHLRFAPARLALTPPSSLLQAPSSSSPPSLRTLPLLQPVDRRPAPLGPSFSGPRSQSGRSCLPASRTSTGRSRRSRSMPTSVRPDPHRMAGKQARRARGRGARGRAEGRGSRWREWTGEKEQATTCRRTVGRAGVLAPGQHLASSQLARPAPLLPPPARRSPEVITPKRARVDTVVPSRPHRTSSLTALMATGFIWVRYSLVIKPVNYSLAAVRPLLFSPPSSRTRAAHRPACTRKCGRSGPVRVRRPID